MLVRDVVDLDSDYTDVTGIDLDQVKHVVKLDQWYPCSLPKSRDLF